MPGSSWAQPAHDAALSFRYIILLPQSDNKATSPSSSICTARDTPDTPTKTGGLLHRSQRRLSFSGADDAPAANRAAAPAATAAPAAAAAPAAHTASSAAHAVHVYNSSIQQQEQQQEEQQQQQQKGQEQQGTHWVDTELGRPQRRRDRLPEHNGVIPGVGLWSLIRDWIGKDLHKLTLPTHLNEPLTDLQRRVEAFEYSELLDEVSGGSFWSKIAVRPSRKHERPLRLIADAQR